MKLLLAILFLSTTTFAQTPCGDLAAKRIKVVRIGAGDMSAFAPSTCHGRRLTLPTSLREI